MKSKHFSYTYIPMKSIPALLLTWLMPTGDGHQTLCLVTHSARMNSNAVLSHTCIYLTYHEEFIQYTHKEFLSFILNKNKTILTIKGQTLMNVPSYNIKEKFEFSVITKVHVSHRGYRYDHVITCAVYLYWHSVAIHHERIVVETTRPETMLDNVQCGLALYEILNKHQWCRYGK